MPVGSYQYKFLVDGVWRFDEKEQYCGDGFGSYNNVIEVIPKLLEAEIFVEVDEKGNHTKKITISTYLGGNEVFILGSWDNWLNKIKMTRRFSYI